MLLPLLPIFAEASLPLPNPDTTRVTVSVTATAAPESSTYKTAASTSSSAFGNGNANVSLYPWQPLVDDASPRSLQPFLQRTSYVAVEGGGQYLRADYSASAGGGTYAQEYVPASASARWFVLPAVAVLGGIGGAHLHDERVPATTSATTRNAWEAWGSVGVDVRSGDASLTLRWQAVGVEEEPIGRPKTAPGFFAPRFALAGRTVIDRSYDVTASAELIPDGAAAGAGFGWYPTKDLGLSLGARIERGQIYWDSTTDYTAIRGGPMLAYWIGRRAELRVSYSPAWVSWAQGAKWNHPVTVGITGRIPGQ